MPRLSTLRAGALADLAEQLRYAPAPAVRRYLQNIDGLAREVDPATAYPEEFVVFRVTGFRPDGAGAGVLPGEALLADLSALPSASQRGPAGAPARARTSSPWRRCASAGW